MNEAFSPKVRYFLILILLLLALAPIILLFYLLGFTSPFSNGLKWAIEHVNYVALGWICVTMVSIVFVYRIVIAAMQGERNVEISWKVTEKVSGRLVITKVQKTTKVSNRWKPKSV